jgi:hypothetical protein
MSPMTETTMEMISPADVQALADAETRKAQTFVEANKIDVTDHDTLQLAVMVREDIGKAKKAIVDKLAEPKTSAFRLHKWFCSLESAALAPYEHLDAYESAQIRVYNVNQMAIRQERERELAEQQRLDAEARATAEAAELERAGDHAMAAAVMEEAIAAPAPVVTIRDEVKSVVSFRRSWKWKYTGGPENVKLTPPAVLARAMELIPRAHLCVDEAKVSAYVRAMKGASSIPGISVYCVEEPLR